MSGYHGGKISESQQSFFDRDGHLDCRKKEESMGYWFLSEWKFTHGKVIHVILFCHICRTTVCWDRKVLQHDIMTSLIDLIIRYLTSLHAFKDWWDKSNVTWFLRGQTSEKNWHWKKSRLSLFILDNRKWRPFHLKYDNVKIWVEGP